MPETAEHEDSSIDETILSTLHELQEREGLVEPSAPKVEAKVEAPAEEPTEQPKERSRDESGRFAKRNSAAEGNADTPLPESIPQAATPEAAEPEAPLVTTTGQPIDINRAPASWKPAAKAAWAALPEQVRAEVYRRESDFLNGNKGLKDNADFGSRVKAEVEPYRMLIEAEGGTPEAAIRDTLRTAALFRVGTPQQKLQALFDLDQRFNAGLRQHFQQSVANEIARQTGQPQQYGYMQPQNQMPYQDPRVDQILSSLQAQERAKAQQEEAVSNAATERFIAAKDASGHPAHPFVDNVLDDMIQRVSNIRRANPSINHEQVLQQAYEAACWADPEVRAVLIGQQQATAQTSADTLRKVEQAKQASRANMPKRGSVPTGRVTAAKLGTPEADSEMLETYRELRGG